MHGLVSSFLEEFHELVELLAVRSEKLKQYQCLFTVDHLRPVSRPSVHATLLWVMCPEGRLDKAAILEIEVELIDEIIDQFENIGVLRS